MCRLSGLGESQRAAASSIICSRRPPPGACHGLAGTTEEEQSWPAETLWFSLVGVIFFTLNIAAGSGFHDRGTYGIDMFAFCI